MRGRTHQRPRGHWGAAAIAAGLAGWGMGVSDASAQTFEVELATDYIETSTFVDHLSDAPMLRAVVSTDFAANGYVEAYVSTGFEDPFRDDSSEVGIEVGGDWEFSADRSLNLAVGRWANYAGAGLDAGDWFARIGVSQGGFSTSASWLAGDSDTVVLNADYAIEATDHLTIRPVVAYFTATDSVNVGVAAEFDLTERLALSVSIVAPDGENEEREPRLAASLVWRPGQPD